MSLTSHWSEPALCDMLVDLTKVRRPFMTESLDQSIDLGMHPFFVKERRCMQGSAADIFQIWFCSVYMQNILESSLFVLKLRFSGRRDNKVVCPCVRTACLLRH